jgi:hypothetical protein
LDIDFFDGGPGNQTPPSVTGDVLEVITAMMNGRGGELYIGRGSGLAWKAEALFTGDFQGLRRKIESVCSRNLWPASKWNTPVSSLIEVEFLAHIHPFCRLVIAPTPDVEGVSLRERILHWQNGRIQQVEKDHELAWQDARRSQALKELETARAPFTGVTRRVSAFLARPMDIDSKEILEWEAAGFEARQVPYDMAATLIRDEGYDYLYIRSSRGVLQRVCSFHPAETSDVWIVRRSRGA